MLEILKHLFGFCGEGHPSILTALTTLPFIIGFRSLIKRGYQQFIQYLKRLVRPRY
jgi:hypothetical protein